MAPSHALTPVELELMNLLWKLGEGNVADLLAALPPERKLAYTSVSTILRILEQKKVLKARKEGRGHVYVPLVSKSTYEASTLHQVVDRVFDGAPTQLMKRLLETHSFSDQELKEIQTLLRNKK